MEDQKKDGLTNSSISSGTLSHTLELLALSIIKSSCCRWSKIFLCYSLVMHVISAQPDLFYISEAGTAAGSSSGKMLTGTGKRISEKALTLSNDGPNVPKVEGAHSHK